MTRLTKNLFAALAVSVLAACAAPSAGNPDPSGSVAVDTSSAESTSASQAPITTSDAPEPSTVTTPGQGAPKPGAEPWPPGLIFGDILEAGTTTLTLGKVTVQLPGGFVASSATSYTSSVPGPAGPATITFSAVAPAADASATLSAQQIWARTAAVSVPNAISAAIGDSVVGGIQTWGLVVIDATGAASLLTVSAAPQDYESYLLYQSVCSVRVSA